MFRQLLYQLVPFAAVVYGIQWPENIGNLLSDGDTFDFIVVGSGSGGSPVASRLAQRGQSVLLLEAGGEPPISTEIPAMCVTIPMSDIDWQFQSQYDARACQSLLNERCHKPRGKVLGGSSAINFMTYIRGNKVDYDDWNITGWTYHTMLPYFLRMESLTEYDDLTPELKRYHNNSGPLRVSVLNASDVVWRDNLLDAYQDIGIVRNKDANGPSQIGVTITHSTIFAGERQSAAKAYLLNLEQTDLKVAYDSLVTKIIIDDLNNTRGVRVKKSDNEIVTIRAKKEVILSAGSINTPQLLMLSGIGPENDLEKHGIHVYVDNAHVDQNLQDHPQISVIFTANKGSAISTSARAEDIFLEQWLDDRSGPFVVISVDDISVFVDSLHNTSVPDLQFMHDFVKRNDTFYSSNLLRRALAFKPEIVKDIQELNKDSEILVVELCLIRPISRGSIHLASANPDDEPLIYGNTLVESDDYRTYLRGIRILEKLLNTETFIQNGVQFARIRSLKECNDLEFQSDDYWLCYHRHLGDTVYHPVGTASIGRVVDERLRVYGVQKLRVADASVMPFISRGNTNAPTIAIGERAADFIAEDHVL